MEKKNEMILEVESRSCNEGLVRIAVAAFSTQLNPTLEEVADIKTAVSEAITNCIVHAYDKGTEKIRVECRNDQRELTVVVKDTGKRHRRCRKSHGASVYHQTGAGPVRHGICFYGGLYGPGNGRIGTGKGNHCDHEKTYRKTESGF